MDVNILYIADVIVTLHHMIKAIYNRRQYLYVGLMLAYTYSAVRIELIYM